MGKHFRSRGIQVKKTLQSPDQASIGMKCYYDADSNTLSALRATCHIDSRLSCFEYSLNRSGNIDSYNFHVDLTVPSDGLFADQTLCVQNQLLEIPKIFDSSFRNYTIGYRIKDGKYIGKIFYFYPTVWKHGRFGIKGVTDPTLIEEYRSRFIKWSNLSQADELTDFWSMIQKFKGISVSVTLYGELEYKIYARIEQNSLYHFVEQTSSTDLSFCKKYGECVLSAQRITNGIVTGYNFYYLS